MPTSTSKKAPKKRNAFSEFMRNASDEEQQRFFMKVIDKSIEDQKAVIEKADRILAERAKNKDSNKADHSSGAD